MDLQILIVSLVVAGSFIYAAWSLMPQVFRRVLAAQLLRLPVPARWRVALRRAAQTSGGCNCSGCPGAPRQGVSKNRVDPTSPAAAQPLIFHRPKKR